MFLQERRFTNTNMSIYRAPVDNVRCMLLGIEENETIFSLLGQTCFTLASAVVQLYLSDTPGQKQWNKRHCGVACFVKDNSQRSYFIRIYCIQKRQLLWEIELYNQFRYRTPQSFFHTFETETCQAGLNFASEDEATKFQSAVEHKLTERHRRKNERLQKKGKSGADGSGQPQHPGVPPYVRRMSVPAQPPRPLIRPQGRRMSEPQAGGKADLPLKKNKKDKGKKLTKADISEPANFRVVDHVGWDPQRGFQMDQLNPDMKKLFESVGIKPEDPNVDKETVNFIYDFVEKFGGYDALRKEMEKRPPPPRPTKSPEQTPSVNQQGPPIQTRLAPKPQTPSHLPQECKGPPSRAPGASPARPPVAAMRVPPPPPPSTFVNPPPRPPIPPHQSDGSILPPPPRPPIPPHQSDGSILPPPPPPIPPHQSDGSILPPPPPPIPPHQSDDSKFPAPPPPIPPEQSGGSDARVNLLSDLRMGQHNLRKVATLTDKPAVPDEVDGLLGALTRALTDRQRYIQDSDEDDDDFDDWDDDY